MFSVSYKCCVCDYDVSRTFMDIGDYLKDAFLKISSVSPVGVGAENKN